MWLWGVTRQGRTCYRQRNIIQDHITEPSYWKNVCYLSSWSCIHCVPVRYLLHIFLGAQLVKTGQSCSLHILHIYSPPDYFRASWKGAPKTSDAFWNLKSSVPATWRGGQCNATLQQWNCLSKRSVTATQRGFRQQFRETWCSSLRYSAALGIKLMPRRIGEDY